MRAKVTGPINKLTLRVKPSKPLLKTKGIKKFKKIFTWFLSQIVLGVVVAGAVSISTLWIEKAQALQNQNQLLQQLTLGTGKNYVDSKFGVAKVEALDKENLLNAYYVFPNAVARVVYDSNDSVVAFFITADTQKPFFDISPYFFGLNGKTLIGEFTYEDSPKAWGGKFEGSVPATNIAYAYYSERFIGTDSSDFDAIVHATYYDGREKASVMPSIGMSIQYDGGSILDTRAVNARKAIGPNTFGLITSDYVDKVNMLPDIDDFQTKMDSLYMFLFHRYPL